MLSMTEDEVRAIMKSNKWTYHIQYRRRKRTEYVFAQRRQGKRKIERYICPLLKLPELTEDQLVEILARPIKKPSSAKREPEVSDTPDPLTNTDEM